MGPAARKALQEAGLNPDDITPSGPNNIITKYDVLQAVAAGVKPGARPAAAAAEAPKQQQSAVAAKPAAGGAAQKSAAAGGAMPTAAAVAKAQPPPAGQYTDIPNTQVRFDASFKLVGGQPSPSAHFA